MKYTRRIAWTQHAKDGTTAYRRSECHLFAHSPLNSGKTWTARPLAGHHRQPRQPLNPVNMTQANRR